MSAAYVRTNLAPVFLFVLLEVSCQGLGLQCARTAILASTEISTILKIRRIK